MATIWMRLPIKYPAPRQDEGEDVDPRAAADRGRIAVVGGEKARAAHDVDRGIGRHDLHQPGDLTGIVLAVAVDLHHAVVAVLEREREAGLDGPADPEVVGQAEHARAGR